MWSWLTLLLIPFGIAAGIIFGALPGFSASTGIVLFMPLSFVLDPFNALVLLLNLYVGAVYGGAIPAILIGLPGAAGAAAQLFDGYPMAKKGRPMEALAINTTSAVIGTLISVLIFLFVAPALSSVALKFGPPEMFWVAVWGLTAIVAMDPKNLTKGMLAGLIGLILGTIGADPMTGSVRMTGGLLELYQGVPFVPALTGLFCFPEVVNNLKFSLSPHAEPPKIIVNTKKLLEGIKMTFKYPKDIISGSLIGTVVGILPGAGASVAAFLAYNQSRMMSKHPEKYGEGAPEGVVSTATAENATVGGAMVPMMTLGVPGSAATAILMAVLMFHGLRPGPSLFMEQWSLISNLVITLLIGSVAMGIIGLLFSRLCSEIVRVDMKVLAPLTLVMIALSAYCSNFSITDIYIMLVCGLIGLVMKKFKYSVTALVLGIILGPIAETNLLQALRMNANNSFNLFTRPLCMVMIAVCLVSLIVPYWNHKRSEKKLSEIDAKKKALAGMSDEEEDLN